MIFTYSKDLNIGSEIRNNIVDPKKKKKKKETYRMDETLSPYATYDMILQQASLTDHNELDQEPENLSSFRFFGSIPFNCSVIALT